jgi:deoxyribose-phosphate aldolase
MEQKELIERISKNVMAQITERMRVNESPSPVNTSETIQQFSVTQEEFAGLIDHTLLKPEAVQSQFDQLCAEALKYRFKSVCVNSGWLAYVSKILSGSGIKICSVVGFPLGAMDSQSKAAETMNAIKNGANEIDMVINVGALRSVNYNYVEEDIRSVRHACGKNAVLKVIIETCLLNEEEKIKACEISKEAGADFVKTSTGFSTAGATVEDVALMRRIVGPNLGVKASGGINTFEKAVAMIHAGANRLGCGASLAIISVIKST